MSDTASPGTSALGGGFRVADTAIDVAALAMTSC
jgi:hypothetical protein